jgi:hypothetical protein
LIIEIQAVISISPKRALATERMVFIHNKSGLVKTYIVNNVMTCQYVFAPFLGGCFWRRALGPLDIKNCYIAQRFFRAS